MSRRKVNRQQMTFEKLSEFQKGEERCMGRHCFVRLATSSLCEMPEVGRYTYKNGRIEGGKMENNREI